MPKTKHVNTQNDKTTTHDDLTERAAALEALAHSLEIEAQALRVQLGRGTQRLPAPARPNGEYSMRAAPKRSAAKPPGGAAETSTADLYAQIEALISERPQAFRELVDATGAGENRIKGVIVRLQRDGKGVVNLGNGSKALWWIDLHGRIAAIAAGAGKVTSPKR